MGTRAKVKFFECIESFGATLPDGDLRWVRKGELVPADDPILKRREWAFRATELESIGGRRR